MTVLIIHNVCRYNKKLIELCIPFTFKLLHLNNDMKFKPIVLSDILSSMNNKTSLVNVIKIIDGGPVIGIQIENEYQHSAAPWGLTYPGQPHDFTASERDRDVTGFWQI